MSRKFSSFSILLLLLSLTIFVVSGCGSGGGGGGGFLPIVGDKTTGDTLTLGIISTDTTTNSYVEKASSISPFAYDPYIYGYFWSGTDTQIQMYDNYDSTLGWESHLLISMPTLSVGTYNVQTNNFYYAKRGISSAYWSDGISGTLTFSRIDSNTGGRIQGTFDNVSMKNNTEVIHVSGDFDVTIQ